MNNLYEIIDIKNPREYVNEPGAIAKAGSYVAPIAKKVFVVGSPTALKLVKALFASFDCEKIVYKVYEYSGYPTYDEAKKIAKLANEFDSGAIVGVGGGRILDLAKACGAYANLTVIAVPTQAATCACWAAVSMMYTAEGVLIEALFNKRSPELIIADTDIIMHAPLRYLCAGIGDTLAKWYESYPNLKTSNDFYLRLTARYGEFSRDILETLGIKVVNDIRRGIYDIENIKEVINCVFLIAGMCGAIHGISDTQGIAHPIYNAASALPKLRDKLHGEKVAFGLVVQAALEGRDAGEIAHRVEIFKKLKLPITLSELGLDSDFEKNFKTINENIKKEKPVYPGLLRPWTSEELRKAIMTADEYARCKKKYPAELQIKYKNALDKIEPFKAARSIESAKREYGFSGVIKLAGNENVHGVSPKVTQALSVLHSEISYYPDTAVMQLRGALSEKLGIAGNELLFGNGSFELISLTALAVLEPDTEAIIPMPSFGWYAIATRAEGATPVFVPLKNHKLDLDAMLAEVTIQTRIIWICNPNNPTGTYVNAAELEDFIKKVPPSILIVLDDAYIDFAPEDFPNTIDLVHQYNNVISLRTFSKVYGLASLRIGYAIGNAALIAKISSVRGAVNVNTFAQTAAFAALQDDDFYNRVLNENAKGKDMYYKKLDSLHIEYIPTACNFIMINTGKDANLVEEEYLKRGILIRNGNEFGMPTWVRITIGTEEQNKKVLDILEDIICH
ncbi:MAG: hypothetical protein Ta2F_00430 [Termitinemataceae bacterium]|nr:MAG: hypothetical protein Ta2F_00430 [Termitinemataceae bacterium]